MFCVWLWLSAFVPHTIRLQCSHLIYCMLSGTVIVLLKIEVDTFYTYILKLYLYYWYFISFSKHRSTVVWKCNPMFVTVLFAPVNLEHRNSTALHNITLPLPPTGLTCCRSTYSAAGLTTVSLCPQQTDTKSNEMCRTAVVTYQCLFFLHVSTAQATFNWHFPSHSLYVPRRAAKGFSLEGSIENVTPICTAVIRSIGGVKHLDTHSCTGLLYWRRGKLCFCI